MRKYSVRCNSPYREYQLGVLAKWDKAVAAWHKRGERGIGGKWGAYLITLEDSAVVTVLGILPVEVAYGQ